VLKKRGHPVVGIRDVFIGHMYSITVAMSVTVQVFLFQFM